MKLYRNILAVGVLATSMSGCLKDTSQVMNAANSPSVIEFANTANLTTNATTNPYALNTIKIAMDPTNPSYNAVISYSGASDAPEDITVTVVSDPTILTAYNTKAGTAYPVLPSTNFTLPSTSVVIKKGTRKVNFPINLLGSDTYFGKNYALPLTIKTASSGTISGNFQHMIYLITGVNRADGIYELHFKMGPNDRGIDEFPVSWYYSDIQMLTQSTTTSALVNINAGTSATSGVHAAVSVGLPTNIPTTVPLITLDPVTYKITAVKNNVTTSTRTLTLNTAAGVDNKLDKTTGNIYLSFTVTETGKLPMLVYDTLFYKTPRP
jgi:hypothetical protein